jgi:hypothetical protein
VSTAARRGSETARPSDTFADVVLLASVVLFVLLAVGIGLLAVKESLH